jgi:hypothetical protein
MLIHLRTTFLMWIIAALISFEMVAKMEETLEEKMNSVVVGIIFIMIFIFLLIVIPG